MSPPATDAEAPLLVGKHAPTWDLRASFGAPLASLVAIILVTYALFTEFEFQEGHVGAYYHFFTHVMLMVFVGFGFLYTFLKNYAASGVGFNFILSVLSMLLAILAVGAAQQGLLVGATKVIKIDLPLLIDAAFCAGAAMVAFGAVIGRATPGQLLAMVVVLVPEYLEVLDVGGSITIHAFGAYFGLAFSRLLHRSGGGAAHPKNGAQPINDITAMVGTLFLYVLWPSFNGALAVTPGAEDSHQARCISNTVVALLGACGAAVAASTLITNKFDMVHLQNATLAGGVAIGSSANLHLPPAAALGVGALAGVISVVGYWWASPWVERVLRVQDTCGVNNLHGMPGILGGLASALFSALPATLLRGNKALLAHGAAQPLYQLAGLGITLTAAAVAGAAVGVVASKADPAAQAVPTDMLYDDAVYWVEEEEEAEGHEE